MSDRKEKKRDEALVERLMRRVLESMGTALDRKLGRDAGPEHGDFTTSTLLERMKRLLQERSRDDGRGGRIAPHHLKLKVEWGTHSEAPQDTFKELEHEILAAAIDFINDQRLRTLAPVKVETVVDIFTTGIAVDPTYGEFEEELKREDEARRRAEEGGLPLPPKALTPQDVGFAVRINTPQGQQDTTLRMKPGGRRLSVGRGSDSDLYLNHPSVSKVHAALLLNREGTLLVADTGSTNGTYINGRRIAYGEARQVEEGDVVGFGDVEVRFKKQ
jgi:hypothetical protein